MSTPKLVILTHPDGGQIEVDAERADLYKSNGWLEKPATK